MSKIETLVKKSALNIKAESKDIITDSEAIKASRHAVYELNHNKTNQNSAAEFVAKEHLMSGTKQMIEYANIYRKSFNDMCSLQTTIMDSAKLLTQKSKDYSNQMGEALARIDKVLVKDFEVKLLLLERFVVASKEMAELEKSGALQRIALSFKA